MSLVKTWYEPQAAAAKFGLAVETLLTWAENGVVRAEREGGQVVLVNIDDVRLEVETMVREG